MKRNLMIAAAAGALLLGAGAMQPAEAQQRGAVRVSSGQHWGGPVAGRNWVRGPIRAHRIVYRGGYYGGGWGGGGWDGWGGGWGFGPAALLGGIAALATAPLWMAGGGFFPGGYGYDYGYGAYPVAYGGGYPIGYGGYAPVAYGSAYPVYYAAPRYVTYAPRRVIYTRRVIAPRNVVRVRYAQPRRVVVQRAGFRPQVQRIQPQRMQPQRVMIRDGARRGGGRVIVR